MVAYRKKDRKEACQRIDSYIFRTFHPLVDQQLTSKRCAIHFWKLVYKISGTWMDSVAMGLVRRCFQLVVIFERNAIGPDRA